MLSLFILISNSCLADATPKFNPNPTLEFYLDGNKTKIDSILVKTYLKNSKSIDTLFFSKYRRDFSQNVILQDDYGIKMDIRTPIDKFQYPKCIVIKLCIKVIPRFLHRSMVVG